MIKSESPKDKVMPKHAYLFVAYAITTLCTHNNTMVTNSW